MIFIIKPLCGPNSTEKLQEQNSVLLQEKVENQKRLENQKVSRSR